MKTLTSEVRNCRIAVVSIASTVEAIPPAPWGLLRHPLALQEYPVHTEQTHSRMTSLVSGVPLGVIEGEQSGKCPFFGQVLRNRKSYVGVSPGMRPNEHSFHSPTEELPHRLIVRILHSSERVITIRTSCNVTTIN